MKPKQGVTFFAAVSDAPIGCIPPNGLRNSFQDHHKLSLW